VRVMYRAVQDGPNPAHLVSSKVLRAAVPTSISKFVAKGAPLLLYKSLRERVQRAV